jgi:hypothetical protein
MLRELFRNERNKREKTGFRNKNKKAMVEILVRITKTGKPAKI